MAVGSVHEVQIAVRSEMREIPHNYSQLTTPGSSAYHKHLGDHVKLTAITDCFTLLALARSLVQVILSSTQYSEVYPGNRQFTHT